MISIMLECDKCGANIVLYGKDRIDPEDRYGACNGWFIDEHGTGCLCNKCYNTLEDQRIADLEEIDKRAVEVPPVIDGDYI